MFRIAEDQDLLRDAYRAYKAGDNFGLAVSLTMLAVDVFTLGGGTAAKALGKTSFKAGEKVTAVGVKVVKSVRDDAVKLIGNNVDNAAKALLDDADIGVRKVADEISEVCSDMINCFARDTVVATPDGPRPIGGIQSGERVLAFDFEIGEWVSREVIERHDSNYYGPLVTVTTDGGPIRATVYHPFWIVRGFDLEERDTPRELAEDEDQGLALAGRWVNSHELRAGDVIIGRDGSELRVRRVEQEYVEAFPVSNLTIEEHHTFAVGNDGVLVHNTAVCILDNAKRGREAEEYLGIKQVGKERVKGPITGKSRYPDQLDDELLTEVKNVEYVYLSGQIQDMIALAKKENVPMVLYVRKSTTVAATVEAFAKTLELDLIIVKILP